MELKYPQKKDISTTKQVDPAPRRFHPQTDKNSTQTSYILMQIGCLLTFTKKQNV